ncbi:MAG: M67 family metallopeptidase [Crenarchaeota archaeon]|nr:M67 family metallopeptidase [Thermoproteota archaeon]MDA1125240.1 M67 family metallopeptidase [Thermoproteota archaeon]
MNKSIILSEKDKQELAKYAESEKPYESCAILVGNETDENWTVKELVLTENTAKSRVTFTISPNKEFEVDQKAKESNMEIICIFHSHPESEAYPSETDKKFMRVNPFPWIIYSGKTEEMNCFILEDENVKQISII